MNLYIENTKRKSVGRTDRNPKSSMNKLSQSVANLGLENFEQDLVVTRVVKSEEPDIIKAGTKHMPRGAKRYSYTPESEAGIIYIPINRLKQVYQTDKATDNSKVKELVSAMNSGKKLPPVQIGYNYDVHDGHHRWEASKKLGYSHVPCEVVGTDKRKVAKAKRKYRGVWKSETTDLLKSLETSLASPMSKIELVRNIQLDSGVAKNIEDEKDAVKSYEDLLMFCDPFVYPIIEEILQDEKDHFINLNLVCDYLRGLISQEDVMSNLRKSLDLFLVVDLNKSGGLNKGKLVRKRVMVRGKNGKVFYRMQWVDPNDKNPDYKETGKTEHTYGHDEGGLKEMERTQSNKFPVLRMDINDMKVQQYNYRPDHVAIKDALTKYHNGDKLPPVQVKPDGTIVKGAEFYEMAKQLKLSHIPVIVVGNPNQKKELEYKLREEVFMEDDDSDGEQHQLTGHNKNEDSESLTKEVLQGVEMFTKVTARKYPKEYLMEQAVSQGITWDSKKKDGTELPKNSAILWMRAHQAIVAHLKEGNAFEVSNDDKQVKKNMKDRGEDPTQKAYLELFGKFNGNKQEFMEYMRENHPWIETKDSDVNWMYCVRHAKKLLAQGKMVNGVRTRQKTLMEKANALITDQMKSEITALGSKHGKDKVMERASTLGITWKTTDKKGNTLPSNSPILWMRAHTAICQHIAEGKEFGMTDHRDTQGLTGELGDAGLSKWQQYAMDWAIRNSRNQEEETKNYAIQCIKYDHGVDDEQAEKEYQDFVKKARNARLMVKLDLFELLPSGVSMLEELSTKNALENNYVLGRGGMTKEHMESNDQYLFDSDYSENVPDKERPIFGVVDLYGQGLNVGSGTSFHGGDVAFVLKDEVKNRATGCHMDSDNIPYGQEGKWVKPLTDPHQILIDRWRYRWKKPNKKNGQRQRAVESVLTGTPHKEDSNYFESQIHGGINLKTDVDHMLIPSAWASDMAYDDIHQAIQQFAKASGITIKYE